MPQSWSLVIDEIARAVAVSVVKELKANGRVYRDGPAPPAAPALKGSAKPRNDLPPVDLSQRYSIGEACTYLRTSRASVYKMMKQGTLRVLRQGKRTFVPGAEIARHSVLDI